MSDLIERLTIMWRAAEYNHKTVGDAIDEIERLRGDRLCRCADEVRCEMKAEIERLRKRLKEHKLHNSDLRSEIERLQAVVDAAQQLIEQGLPKRTKQDQWNAWHILKDALEDRDE